MNKPAIVEGLSRAKYEVTVCPVGSRDGTVRRGMTENVALSSAYVSLAQGSQVWVARVDPQSFERYIVFAASPCQRDV